MFNFNQLEKYTECDNTEVNEQFQNCIIRYISGRLQGWYDWMGWQWTLLFICQVDSGCSRLTGGCGQGTVQALPEHKHLVHKSTKYFDSWLSFFLPTEGRKSAILRKQARERCQRQIVRWRADYMFSIVYPQVNKNQF